MSTPEDIKDRMRSATGAAGPGFVQRVAVDLAVALGLDTEQVLETMDSIADDSDSSREEVVAAIVSALAPYDRPELIRVVRYVAVDLGRLLNASDWRNAVRAFAIQECNWPANTTIAGGVHFELEALDSGLTAYVISHAPGRYLVPFYDGALAKMIDQRDRSRGADIFVDEAIEVEEDHESFADKIARMMAVFRNGTLTMLRAISSKKEKRSEEPPIPYGPGPGHFRAHRVPVSFRVTIGRLSIGLPVSTDIDAAAVEARARSPPGHRLMA